MKKKISVITGGHSGLGYSIAKALVMQGENVCIIGRNDEKLKNAEEVLKKETSNEVISKRFDISDEGAVKACYKNLEDDGFIVDKLFNVAGIGIFGHPTTVTKEKIETTFNGNLIGLILMTTEALKTMEKEGGSIINVLSTAATKGNAKEPIYCASKWGAKGYTESLKSAYKGSKIKILAVYPGGLNTPFWNSETALPIDKDTLMDPDEVADQIVFATSSSSKMNVSEMMIDRWA